MARTVKIDEIGRLIDEKPYNIPWFSFDLGGGWGSRLTKYNKKGAARGLSVAYDCRAAAAPELF